MSAVADSDKGRRIVARNAVHLVLGQWTTTALGLLFSAVLGRTLGVHDFGIYFLIVSFSTFAFVLVDWGQQLYLVRELARRPELSGLFLGTTLLLRVIGTALVAVPFGLAAWLLGYDLDTSWYTIGFIAVSLPFFLAQAYGTVFRSRDRMDLDALSSVVNKAALLAFAVVALVLGARLPGVLVAHALAGIVALALSIRLYRQRVSNPLSYSSDAAREILAAGGMLFPILVANNVQPYIDAVLLAKLTPPDAVGWYGAAKNISGALFAPGLILGAALYPRLARIAANPDAIRAEAQPALRPFLWLGALAATGTFLFAEDAVAIVYGREQFAPSAVVLKVYAPALFLLFTNVLLGYALLARERVAQLTVLKIVSLVVATALELVLIPVLQGATRNGGLGVAAAFLASETVVFVGELYLLRREGIGLKVAADMARALGAAALTLILFWWLPPLPFVAGVPVCVIAFVIASFGLRLVGREDILFCQSLLRKEVARA